MPLDVCSTIPNICAAAQIYWGEAVDRGTMKHAEAASVMIARQTSQLAPLDRRDKDVTLTVYWSDSCTLDCVAGAGDCVSSYAEPSGQCKEYKHDGANLCHIPFSLSEEQFRDDCANPEEVLGRQLMQVINKADQDIAEFVLTQLDASAGVNAYTGAPGQVSGTTTYIPPSYWTSDLIAYFVLVAQINNMTNPFIISGNAMFEQAWNAQFKGAGCCPDEQAKYSAMPLSFAVNNFLSVFGSTKKLYLVDANSYVVDNYWRYPETPVSTGDRDGTIRFSVASNNFPGVRYDVISHADCINGGRDTRRNWKLFEDPYFFTNPVSECDPTNTGILCFECGTAP